VVNFINFFCRVFLPVSTGAKSIKNPPRKTRAIIKNKVARFYGSRCMGKTSRLVLVIIDMLEAIMPSLSEIVEFKMCSMKSCICE